MTDPKGIAQSIRVDNIWESGTSFISFSVTSTTQVVQIRYTPSSQGDGRAFLNGFEIDSPAMGNRIKFPTPAHRDERVSLNGGSVTASWRAPSAVSSPRYNVYLGTSSTAMRSVSLGQSGTQVTLSGVLLVPAGHILLQAVIDLVQASTPSGHSTGEWMSYPVAPPMLDRPSCSEPLNSHFQGLRVGGKSLLRRHLY